MKRVLLTGPILTKSGYGEHARLIYRALTDADSRPNIDLYVEPLVWGKTGWLWEDTPERAQIDELIFRTSQYEGDYDVHIHVGILNELQPRAPRTVCVTAGIETTKVPPRWLEVMNEIDKVVVPSMHAKWVFDNTVYKDEAGNKLKNNDENKVSIWPYTVLDQENKEPFELNLDTEFNFLTVAQLSPRKNVEFLLEGFIEEFREDPNIGLVMKLSFSSNSIMDYHITKSRLTNLLSQYGDRQCKIYLLHGDLTENQMMGLYSNEKINGYVTTTHGEGFGLPIFEAVQFDIPVIAPRFSGHLDFLYAESSPDEPRKPKFLGIDVELRHVQPEAQMSGLILRDSMWAYSDPVQFRAHMRDLVENYEKHKKIAVELGEYTKQKYSKQNIFPGMVRDLLGPVTAWDQAIERVELVS